jgi:AcrR family transcriptional regulator
VPRVGLTRERVLDLAEAIVDADGPDALTLTRLAAQAGVRVPSLYKHVDGLADVLGALTVRALEGMAAALDFAGRTGDPREDVRVLARAWRHGGRSSPGLYALTLRTHLRGDPRVFTIGERLVREVTDRLGALGLEGVDRVHAARAFRALVHGFVVLETGEGFGIPVDVDASFEAAIDALLAGWSRAAAERGGADAGDLGAGRER